jgi:RNA polymerase sigma factor (sigma-70 family)
MATITRSIDAEARVARVLERHGAALQATARRYSLCADDAHDAVQRGLEIYLRRLATVEEATEGAWLRTVVRHEALAVRRGRGEAAGGDELLESVPADRRSADEGAATREHLDRAGEALGRLKHDEARALLMKASGHSYQEIGERLGWSYTKVNRCISEGRARFLKAYAEIEAGGTCRRMAPLLAALAAGEAGAKDLLAVRPHVRHCSACRATIRALRMPRLARAALFVPVVPGLAGAKAAVGGWLGRAPLPDAMLAGAQLAPAGRGLATVGAIAGLCVGGAFCLDGPAPAAKAPVAKVAPPARARAHRPPPRRAAAAPRLASPVLSAPAAPARRTSRARPAVRSGVGREFGAARRAPRRLAEFAPTTEPGAPRRLAEFAPEPGTPRRPEAVARTAAAELPARATATRATGRTASAGDAGEFAVE